MLMDWFDSQSFEIDMWALGAREPNVVYYPTNLKLSVRDLEVPDQQASTKV